MDLHTNDNAYETVNVNVDDFFIKKKKWESCKKKTHRNENYTFS